MKALKSLTSRVKKHNKDGSPLRAILFDKGMARAVLGEQGHPVHVVISHSVGIVNHPGNIKKPLLLQADDVARVLGVLSKNDAMTWHDSEKKMNGIRCTPFLEITEFPDAPIPPGEPVASAFDITALKTAFPYCADRDIRYYLNGAVFDLAAQVIVATNGHHMVKVETALPKAEGQIIVHRDALEAAIAFNATEMIVWPGISFAAAYVAFTFEGGMIVSKAVDGKFPDYTRVIPDAAKYAVIFPDASIMLDDAKKCVAMNKGKSFCGVKVTVDKSVTFTDSHDIASFKIAEPDGGKPRSIKATTGINGHYLVQAIQTIGHGAFLLSTDRPADQPMLFTREGVTVIVMPMRA